MNLDKYICYANNCLFLFRYEHNEDILYITFEYDFNKYGLKILKPYLNEDSIYAAIDALTRHYNKLIS